MYFTAIEIMNLAIFFSAMIVAREDKVKNFDNY